jgi:hypothetical protein
MRCAACTILSTNYLHFGWTLAESFLKFHPSCEFHILVVDRLPEGFQPVNSAARVLQVESLGLPDFRSLAFKFDILELNTAVKPSFLKYLFRQGAEKVIYLDPDIYVFQPLEFIYETLDASSVVLTPHVLSPTPDSGHAYERICLGVGSFNLGFVAVSNRREGLNFLDWWEERCLNFGFSDVRTGLFVDQKWVDLAACFFPHVHILRHQGCNVGYWNLQERIVGGKNGVFTVNDSTPLAFYHFSGRTATSTELVSSNANPSVHYEISDALRSVFNLYRERLVANGADRYTGYKYAFGAFSNGMPVTRLIRRIYAATIEHWRNEDPFDVANKFYKSAKKAGLISRTDTSRRYNSYNLPKHDWRIRAINRFLFFLPRIIGGDKYTMLMKYLSYISVLRHQGELIHP